MDSEMMKLIQVAKLYYEENMTQSQIAKQIGVSRPLISNMLTKARNTGIVEIKIKEPFGNNLLLLNQLKNIFNVQGGNVLPSSNSAYLTDKAIINQAQFFIKEELSETKTMGLGWGYTIGQIVEALKDEDFSGSNEGVVCPLIGTATIPNKGYHPSELVREFSMKTGFDPHFLFAPAFPTTDQEQGLYINTDNYQDLVQVWDQLDMVVFGLGAYPSVPDHATALRFGKELNKKRAVGKFLSYFFDKDGQIIHGENDFAIQIPLSKLGRVKRVVAVCPAEINAKAILGALKTGFITHIIITEEKAKEVIAYKAY
jgi:DNA-binding transcriptional regulator LsrR (DeoR family)